MKITRQTRSVYTLFSCHQSGVYYGMDCIQLGVDGMEVWEYKLVLARETDLTCVEMNWEVTEIGLG